MKKFVLSILAGVVAYMALILCASFAISILQISDSAKEVASVFSILLGILGGVIAAVITSVEVD